MSDIATTLADFTLPELMIPALRPGGAGAVIGELCRALERAGRVPDGLALYDAVMAREKVCGTAAPDGWALPHARMAGLAALSFAVGRTTTALDWLETPQQPVRLVFLCAVPEGDTTYLRLIAGVARLMQDRARLANLLRAANGEEMFRVLHEISLPRPPAGRRMASA